MPKIYVAGGINMDIVVTVSRHPKLGETIFGNDLNYYPGGNGANQAIAASKLGSTVNMIGAVGNYSFGNNLISFLRENRLKNH